MPSPASTFGTNNRGALPIRNRPTFTPVLPAARGASSRAAFANAALRLRNGSASENTGFGKDAGNCAVTARPALIVP